MTSTHVLNHARSPRACRQMCVQYRRGTLNTKELLFTFYAFRLNVNGTASKWVVQRALCSPQLHSPERKVTTCSAHLSTSSVAHANTRLSVLSETDGGIHRSETRADTQTSAEINRIRQRTCTFFVARIKCCTTDFIHYQPLHSVPNYHIYTLL